MATPVVRGAAVLPAPITVVSRTVVPVVLRATAREAAGATMRVAGVRVIDRAIRQLGRLRDARVVIADDGSIPLPRRLPPSFERREIHGDVVSAIEELCAELGPETAVVSADTVWTTPARFDKATRVVDRPSRELALDAVFWDAQRDSLGIVDRLVNQRIWSRITRWFLIHLPIAPGLLTLASGFAGLYGALMVAAGTNSSVVWGFAALEGCVILDGCAAELARVRMHQSALGAWLDTVVGDFVNVVMILAVGLALWHHGGTYLDMKMALAAAGMTLFYMAVAYRELMRQGERDVMKLRWWFAYGQPLRNFGGAGSQPIRAVMLLGRRDVVVLLSLALSFFDQLPVAMIYMMIVAIVRAGGALGQLFAPDWRYRPPA
jgi:hypothetical protein